MFNVQQLISTISMNSSCNIPGDWVMASYAQPCNSATRQYSDGWQHSSTCVQALYGQQSRYMHSATIWDYRTLGESMTNMMRSGGHGLTMCTGGCMSGACGASRSCCGAGPIARMRLSGSRGEMFYPLFAVRNEPYTLGIGILGPSRIGFRMRALVTVVV